MSVDLEKLRSISVLKPTTTSATEKRWEKDMQAYKAMRKNGLQPRGIDGCAELEAKANTKLELEMGHLFPDKRDLALAREGMDRAQEMGLGD